jgi:hypothetical protein
VEALPSLPVMRKAHPLCCALEETVFGINPLRALQPQRSPENQVSSSYFVSC